MRRALPLALAAIVAAPLAGSALAAPDKLPPAASSPGMKLVAQIPGPGGTDLEFFSRTLTRYRDAKGNMVSGKPTVRHFAVVGNETSNTRIVDITTPEKPFVASTIACAISQGDVQINEKRSLIILANGGGASRKCEYADPKTGEVKPLPSGAAIVDMKDVYNPKVVAAAAAADGAHNVTLTPDGMHLYISTSTITEAQSVVPIYDLADIRSPKLVTTWSAPGNSPHDIRFNAKGNRAYTAGVSTFRILDTTDIHNPKVVSTFFPPGASIGHDVLVSPDGAFLFAGDEAGGDLTYPCPGGAVHVFNLLDERAPVYIGAAYAGVGPVTNRDLTGAEAGTPGSCTSHVMSMNPDGKSFTIAWYAGGSRVFDFTGLYEANGDPGLDVAAASYGNTGIGLVESGWIRPEGGTAWSAKQYAKVPGYIFSDDLDLGFYVTKLPPKKS